MVRYHTSKVRVRSFAATANKNSSAILLVKIAVAVAGSKLANCESEANCECEAIILEDGQYTSRGTSTVAPRPIGAVFYAWWTDGLGEGLLAQFKGVCDGSKSLMLGQRRM